MDILFSSDWLAVLGGLLALGLVSGFFAGLLGVGGGAVLVPGLFYLFRYLGVDESLIMHMAVGTSLAIIVPTGLSSAWAHWRRGAVDLYLVRRIGPGIVLGTVAGSLIAKTVHGDVLGMVFSVVILMLALVMLVDSARFSLRDDVPPQPWSALAGMFIGGLSTLIGIGGASFSVPFMSLCRVPIHRAIGTAAALGLAISIPGALGFMAIGAGQGALPSYTLGYIYLPACAIVGLSAVFCAPLGVKVAHGLPVARLRKIFAVFLMIVALKMGSEFL